MAHTIEDQTLALAGVVQACLLVRELAHQGEAPEGPMRASLESLFRFDAADVPSVYGGVSNVGEGLRHLRKQLAGQTGKQDVDITRHALTLLQLAKQLLQHPDMMGTIQRQLQLLEHGFMTAGPLSAEVVETLARVYQQTISTLSPKIIVNGNPNQLAKAAVAQQIRAALLAGIRSAVLWHQCGGSKWNLLLKRKHFMTTAERLLRGGMRVVERV
ncbi:MAG: high frequency lysogenization protein HflD [Halothiobacillaceae bacterium]|nr:MAG: high frequency lysogenization protein HflD [Halothiobacillaceae bacterium]